MKRLILLRHAKSSWKNPGLRDFDRPLNSRGKHNAPMMGKRLVTKGVLPKILISSPAKRAWKTAVLVGKELGYSKGSIIADPAIYDAGMNDLLKLVRNFQDDWDDVMLVGHNPGLTEFAEYLTGEELVNLPTCAVCCIDLPIDSWADIRRKSGAMLLYDFPKSIFVAS
jgi:phosphohistidine phosphatase